MILIRGFAIGEGYHAKAQLEISKAGSWGNLPYPVNGRCNSFHVFSTILCLVRHLQSGIARFSL
jgi:hypothetical protein